MLCGAWCAGKHSPSGVWVMPILSLELREEIHVRPQSWDGTMAKQGPGLQVGGWVPGGSGLLLSLGTRGSPHSSLSGSGCSSHKAVILSSFLVAFFVSLLFISYLVKLAVAVQSCASWPRCASVRGANPSLMITMFWSLRRWLVLKSGCYVNISTQNQTNTVLFCDSAALSCLTALKNDFWLNCVTRGWKCSCSIGSIYLLCAGQALCLCPMSDDLCLAAEDPWLLVLPWKGGTDLHPHRCVLPEQSLLLYWLFWVYLKAAQQYSITVW